MSKPKNSKKLPKVLIPLGNSDKKKHEKWYPGRDLLDIPSPYRMCIAGGVNLGKTNTVLNLILRANPPFEEIFVYHCDKKSKDYELIEATYLDDIPAPDEWDWDKKKLLILDDISYSKLNKIQQSNLNRVLGFCSTHKMTSVILTTQTFFSIPPDIRRMCSNFIVYDSPDKTSHKLVANRCGLKQEEFLALFENFKEHFRDSLWIDLTLKTPALIRRNGYEVITIEKIRNGENTE